MDLAAAASASCQAGIRTGIWGHAGTRNCLSTWTCWRRRARDWRIGHSTDGRQAQYEVAWWLGCDRPAGSPIATSPAPVSLAPLQQSTFSRQTSGSYTVDMSQKRNLRPAPGLPVPQSWPSREIRPVSSKGVPISGLEWVPRSTLRPPGHQSGSPTDRLGSLTRKRKPLIFPLGLYSP